MASRLPALPTSLLATIGNLIGVGEERALGAGDLPGIKQLLEGVPASVLVGQGQAQARLPFDIRWE